MEQFNLYKPNMLDIQEMEELVFQEVENGNILERDKNEMANTIRSYISIKNNKNKIIGFVALHIHTISLAEIRSLIVKKEYRGNSIAKRLIKACIDEAKNLKIKELLVLTYKEQLFKYFNFKVIEKASIPEPKIWADCIKCKHFPICNEISLMLKL